MHKSISFKIKIQEKDSYLQLLSTCSEIYDKYIEWAFENKSYNKGKCHNDLYKNFRTIYSNIPSAILQSIRDTALESCKATKFKFKPKKKKLSIRYDKRTMTLRGDQLTFSTSNKRQKVILSFPEYFTEVKENWKFTGGTICYRNNNFYVNLTFFKEDPPKINNQEVLGIDRGIYNIVTLSNKEIISGQPVRKQQRKYLYLRKKLQEKGTPSSKRKLKKLSGKEKRFNQDFNHRISKYVSKLNYGIYAIEDLKGISKTKQGKKLNKWIHSWPFYQFEMFLTYKCISLGKRVIKVDARYTSQKCSVCENIDKQNRNKSKFLCTKCGYTEHSDINASINIKNNYLFSLLLKSEKQGAVNHPNVST